MDETLTRWQVQHLLALLDGDRVKTKKALEILNLEEPEPVTAHVGVSMQHLRSAGLRDTKTCVLVTPATRSRLLGRHVDKAAWHPHPDWQRVDPERYADLTNCVAAAIRGALLPL